MLAGCYVVGEFVVGEFVVGEFVGGYIIHNKSIILLALTDLAIKVSEYFSTYSWRNLFR